MGMSGLIYTALRWLGWLVGWLDGWLVGGAASAGSGGKFNLAEKVLYAWSEFGLGLARFSPVLSPPSPTQGLNSQS